MKKLLTISLLFVVIGILCAQTTTPHCGVTTEDGIKESARLKTNFQSIPEGLVSERGAFNYVPIHFHRVGTNSGGGKVTIKRVLDQLCLLNDNFAMHEIKFYLSPHPTNGLFGETINNTDIYNTQSNTAVMETARHNNALNVYIVNKAESNDAILGYYNGSNDWVVVRRDQVGIDNATVTHEIGHFFSLLHPHLGWEFQAFENNASNPTFPIAPATSPGGVATELMNGSNATTAGDMLGDTKPDYNFGLANSGCSPYNRLAKDPLGVLVNPDENNFMGYFSLCDYVFSPQQVAVMKVDINSPARNFLDNSFTPYATALTTPSNMAISPTQLSVAPYYNNVVFNWNTVAGASHYLFELDTSANFNSTKLQSYVVTSNTTTVNNLQSNRFHHWHVRPFNAADACPAFTNTIKFNTGLTALSNNEIQSIPEWNLYPNPISQATKFLQINLQATDNFEIEVILTDISGRTITQLNGQSLTYGDNSLQLSIAGVSAGLYFVSVRAGKQVTTKKLVVLP